MSTKRCNGCNKDRDIEDFNLKDRTKGTLQALCRFCIAEYGKEHYKNNKQAYIDKAKSRNKRIREENRTKLFAYLSQHPCVDCGQTDIRCLEFDHVRGNKTYNVATLIKNLASWSTIETEIAKCEVRCANCRRRKTLERGKWWRFGRTLP